MLAGAQHNERKVYQVCQPPPGTTRPAAQSAPVWDNVDSDVALRRGIGYLHARDDFQSESLPATSCELVDRQASDPALRAILLREDSGVMMIWTGLSKRRDRIWKTDSWIAATVNARQRSVHQQMLSSLRR